MPLLSVSYLSEITGVDRRKARARLEPLKPTKQGTAHLYESRDALRLLLADASNGERLDPSRERALLDRARREQIEVENRRRAGELIEAARVGEIWAKHIETAKGRLLSIPGANAGKLFRAESVADIEQRLRDALMSVMEEIANAGMD